jgi:hypothetical protein
MLTCCGCRVAKFCSADLAKMASTKAALGGSLWTGRHKDICGALSKWREVVKESVPPDSCTAELVTFLQRRLHAMTQHWVSRTRATVSSYRMQRESDVCESVCEAGVLVHGSRRCHACYLCLCAQCVCLFESLVETSSATISREQGPNKLSHPHPPCARPVLRCAQIPSAPKAARTHARTRTLSASASPSMPPCFPLPLSLPLPLSVIVCRLREEHR